jgi:hypothetical protein
MEALAAWSPACVAWAAVLATRAAGRPEYGASLATAPRRAPRTASRRRSSALRLCVVTLWCRLCCEWHVTPRDVSAARYGTTRRLGAASASAPRHDLAVGELPRSATSRPPRAAGELRHRAAAGCLRCDAGEAPLLAVTAMDPRRAVAASGTAHRARAGARTWPPRRTLPVHGRSSVEGPAREASVGEGLETGKGTRNETVRVEARRRLVGLLRAVSRNGRSNGRVLSSTPTHISSLRPRHPLARYGAQQRPRALLDAHPHLISAPSAPAGARLRSKENVPVPHFRPDG